MTIATDNAAQQLAHHLTLIIDNEQDYYWSRRGIVRQAITDARALAADDPDVDYVKRASWTAGEALRDALRAGMDTQMERLDALPRELLSVAMRVIDWDAIGRLYVEEELNEEG